MALYVEAKQARAELQRLKAEGFFSEGYTDDRVMEALVQGRSEVTYSLSRALLSDVDRYMYQKYLGQCMFTQSCC